MKFGVFYNPMVPKASGEDDWAPGRERKALNDMLEQIRFADSLGFDYVFLGEHHFMPEYAHNSATEVLLGALSQTTTNIRIGTGIVHASHNDPIRTAERIATLDQLTAGRAEFGFGPGTPQEIEPWLKEDLPRRAERADASAQISIDVLASRKVWPGADNEFFQFPAGNVVPKSFQTPHPPLWTSTSRPGQARSVAARGLGQLMLTLAGPESVASEVELYWETLRSGAVKPMGRGINPAVFTFTVGLLAPTDELAQERAREGVEFYGFGLTGGAMARIGDPEHHLWDAFQDFKAGRGDIRLEAGTPPMMLEMGARFADLPGVMMCGPEKAREFTRQIEATHADGLLLNQQFGWTEHEHLMESLEIWATQVIPEFREREAEHQAWRKEQLDGIALPVVTSV
ncbi:flavin-dependent oxidoreductase [Actinomadura sp. NBRC 104425]|uniref:LLM class flavin-dependent oxidoreductase n=1 Tax=Actinomadura sp. NBRC 104425 TaxID=3032204 RepID=UPI0024A4FF62|nr:LLM class flavin-dependent oxidoreductase [Actinomadura sp. NBRC 104425]GLZ11992.1 flavin-dependent oxidoreductase [Actinomadura sp. NBRC 104425]